MKVGDKVSVIKETIQGTILEIGEISVLILDEDGFERQYESSELAIVQGDYKLVDEQITKEIREKLKVQQAQQHVLKSFEIDLHIEELVEDHKYMTNHEILTKQMTVCRGFIQNALGNDTPRIVLIHGKGEGVLKSEIHLFLNKLRNFNDINLEYHDASFSEYGMGGATEVLFR